MNNKVLFLLVTGPFILLFFTLIFFLFNFRGELSTLISSVESLGQAGDFFGGIMGPALAYFSFLGLIYTIGLNKKVLYISQQELIFSREEIRRSTLAQLELNEQIKHQRLENTYFALLTHLSELAKDVSIDSQKLTERDFKTENIVFPSSGKDGLRVLLNIYYAFRIENPSHNASESSLLVFDKLSDLMDFYFDTVNLILKFIISDEFKNKEFYMALLTAQMTKDELILLFYYALGGHGSSYQESIIHSGLFGSLSYTSLFSSEDKYFLKKMVMVQPDEMNS